HLDEPAAMLERFAQITDLDASAGHWEEGGYFARPTVSTNGPARLPIGCPLRIQRSRGLANASSPRTGVVSPCSGPVGPARGTSPPRRSAGIARFASERLRDAASTRHSPPATFGGSLLRVDDSLRRGEECCTVTA